MYGKNSELLVRVFGANRFTKKEKWTQISLEKEKKKVPGRTFAPTSNLIAGLDQFL